MTPIYFSSAIWCFHPTFPVSPPWVDAVTDFTHGGVWFSTKCWVQGLLFVGGLPSLNLSEIWTFILVLLSFIFICCQVKTKRTLIRRRKPHYKEPGMGTEGQGMKGSGEIRA